MIWKIAMSMIYLARRVESCFELLITYVYTRLSGSFFHLLALTVNVFVFCFIIIYMHKSYGREPSRFWRRLKHSAVPSAPLLKVKRMWQPNITERLTGCRTQTDIRLKHRFSESCQSLPYTLQNELSADIKLTAQGKGTQMNLLHVRVLGSTEGNYLLSRPFPLLQISIHHISMLYISLPSSLM